MAIDTKNLGLIQAYQQNSNMPNNAERALEKANEHSRVAQSEEKPNLSATQMTIRNERQASLVAHLFGDGTSAQESSLKITFQAAIEKLNEVLMADMPALADGEESINPISEEALKKQGGMEYWTPENTAKRIVDGATAFLSGFKTAHPELEGEALMERFMDVVGGGLTQGFEEARSILGDLNVLEGEIAGNIDTTYQLVQDGLLSFKNLYLGIEPVTTDENKA
ncbi:DUF5610 domain-containing protein [Thiomicrorhabdus sp. Kp2]|uniref:DUF5610 domain-containing protein n=1 Tax=Thiomicrorhabdus sp. Kp2 TaxID=1123518 RepID=UPI0003FD7807|nr:DUF5610 domain-containing protein [Thiomicrorhabdus sp. Kp2]